MHRRSYQKGIALLLVLWMLIILVGIIGVFALTASTERQQGKLLARTVQARYAAEGGIDVATLRLGNADPLLQWVPDNRVYKYTVDKTQIEIRTVDESGKVDINVAGADVIYSLLLAVGADAQKAQTISSAIMDWRDPDDLLTLPGGAEDDQYEAADRPYGSKDGAFQTIAELQQVLGMTPELFAKLQPFITIYSGLARPNPSFAAPEVLAALGLQAPQIAQLLAQREAWQPGMPVFTLPDGNPLATSGTGTYSISSLAIEPDGSRAEITAILRVGSNGNFGQLYTPLAWRVGAND
ncbi:MAG: general secretion pathway protein GspK [Arenimonas sp.]